MESNELLRLLEAAQDVPVSQVDLSASTKRIKVDMDTRKITGHTEFGVIRDHLAETVVFEVKRYKGDTDLAEKNCAIHWENGENGGVLPVTEIDLSEDGHILMRWELHDEFTQHEGKIVYALHFFSILDGGFTYHAATNAAAGMLGGTLNASAHSRNKITPSEIEVYIAKMNALSAEIDRRLEDLVISDEQAQKAVDKYLATKVPTREEFSQLSSEIANKPDRTEIPVKTSQLTNNSGFLTEIPPEYVTEEELNAKGYLTSVPSEYMTEDEVKAMGIQQVPLFANSIEECTDKSKCYVLPDGYIYGYIKKEAATVGEWSENLVSTSIDTDGSIFNGTGYKDEYRLNSSGAVTSQADATVIGFIPAKKGDKFQITGVRFGTQATCGIYGYVSIYDSNKTKLVSVSMDTFSGNPSNYGFTVSPLPTSGTVKPTDVTTIDFANVTDNMAFVRFSASIQLTSDGSVAKQSGADMVVQKWTEGGTEVTEAWHNTGRAFVPADYESAILSMQADILNLQKSNLEQKERIDELEENGLSGLASNIIPDGLEWLKGYNIPRLILNGSTDGMTKDNAVTLNYECEDKDGNAKTGSCTLKWQGSSSIAWEKKNYTINFDNAFEVVSGWGSQKKYCLKANFIDHSHARNVVSAKLWGQVTKSRTSVDSRLSALPNAGAVDGFPIIIILNGEFHGVYTWNIPKDGWMFGMSGTSSQQAIVCADGDTDATRYFTGLAVLDGSDYELEYSSDGASEWVKTSLNRMLQAVINSNGSDLDTTVSQYIDINSAIDYMIFTTLIENADGVARNFLLATYDGVKWFFSSYDMDSTFGLHWHGKDFSGLSSVPTFQSWRDNKLMSLLWAKKRDVINARYEQLRANAMSEYNVAKTLWNFGCLIPKALLLKDVEKWTSIPSSSVNDTNQILAQYRLRCMLVDEWIKA